MSDPGSAEDALARLQQQLEALGPVAVAVSGGVDSMTLACVAHRVNSQSHLFHALSAAVPAAATARVKHYASREGWNLALIDAGELRDPTYVSNPVDRCYFCKSCLYDTIQQQTELTVASGTNLDDLSDYRPGLRAASEHEVLHPYVEAGIDKQMVRAIARLLGLDDLSELPASPCLSSRVTTGIAIDPVMLQAIDAVESEIWKVVDHAVSGVRCRIRKETGSREEVVTIELELADGGSAVEHYAAPVTRTAVSVLALHGVSDRYGSIAVEPYRRGSAFLIESVQVDD